MDVSLKDLKSVENAVTRITPQATLHTAVLITLDRLCQRVNLLTSKLAEAEAPAKVVEKAKAKAAKAEKDEVTNEEV